MADPNLTADVLVIDDDRDVRDCLACALSRGGRTVATATGGRQALEYLLAHAAPRVIVLGLSMPGMDGWEFLTRRGRHPHLRAVPVVAYAASVECDAAEAGEPGAAPVLFRPFDLAKILHAARPYCLPLTPAA